MTTIRKITSIPSVLKAIQEDTERLGFTLSSDAQTGSLLATLAASKPNGRLLEIGTGTGHGTAWILSGMDESSHLDTVDINKSLVAVAKKHIGDDARVTFHLMGGDKFIQQAQAESFDLIYADAIPGKFSHLDETLALLKPGGFYIIDDLLPQPTWPENHATRVAALIDELEKRSELRCTQLGWSSGLMLVTQASIRALMDV